MRILIFIASLFIVTSNFAQYNHRKNIIKINPLGGIASSIPVTLERFFFKNYFSIGFNFTYILNYSGSKQSTYNNKGIIIMPQIRHYFFSDTTNNISIYIGGFYTYEEHSNTTLDRYEKPINGQVYGQGGGMLFGSQWFLKNGFVFDIFVGPGYVEYKRNENYDNNVAKGGFLVGFTGPKNTGAKVKIGFTIGYSF